MYDTILGEEDIFGAVMRLRMHHVGIPSGMKAKYLQMWHRAEKWKEDPGPGNW